ncbi:hypothetical protein AAFF_G00047350 [Aldrovandia affinis]|uniref:Uncharacterized protein n=1 Tax=Aldrovandia affinis TaxID=143900 RepID=A0AAD7S1Q4_9TELE|nr:hypothetical protein AAFF_G00047350 [Aldrovandia affinis]
MLQRPGDVGNWRGCDGLDALVRVKRPGVVEGSGGGGITLTCGLQQQIQTQQAPGSSTALLSKLCVSTSSSLLGPDGYRGDKLGSERDEKPSVRFCFLTAHPPGRSEQEQH